MANINGNMKRRVNLIANVEQTIEFAGNIQSISLANAGVGTVAYKVNNGPVTSMADDSANILTEALPIVDIKKPVALIKTISLMADKNTIVQWDFC